MQTQSLAVVQANGVPPTSHQVIGRVVATERQPNTAYEFHFWATEDAPLGIGALVKVDAGARKVWGRHHRRLHLQRCAQPISGLPGLRRHPLMPMPTVRTEIRLYRAAVLRHYPEQPVQPPPIAPFYLATEADVH
jgi:hypothetical protein